MIVRRITEKYCFLQELNRSIQYTDRQSESVHKNNCFLKIAYSELILFYAQHHIIHNVHIL